MDSNDAAPPAETTIETASGAPKPGASKKNRQKSGGPVSQLTGARQPEMRQDGLQIDGFGLPVNRIARRCVLKELGADDPLVTGGWDHEAKARKLTEKFYG